MGKRVGVLLSGCGALDGTEIHGTVLTLLFLDRAGAEAICAAPDADQVHVLNHMSSEEMAQRRNVLIESARIARGNIIDLASLKAERIDALMLPGGFGAVKNLCDFAIKGPDAVVHPEVARLLRQVHAASKPIGASGIASVTVASALGAFSPAVTIGEDGGIAAAIETMGATHHPCRVDEIHIDDRNKIVTTPADMLRADMPGPGIGEVAMGIEKLVTHLLALAD
jgi:enhancing lycopene biosynthesis protein 2